MSSYRPIIKRTRGYLPHWEREAGLYRLDFHLADSLPAKVRERILEQRRAIARAEKSGRDLLAIERLTKWQLAQAQGDAYLDAGAGECLFKRAELAEIVAQALRFWDGTRYDLEAWCVMPNHVHVVLQMREQERLASIAGSWKSYSSHQINAALGRQGTVWERESFDRLIRNEGELARTIEYIRTNPERAGLTNWRWVYVKKR